MEPKEESRPITLADIDRMVSELHKTVIRARDAAQDAGRGLLDLGATITKYRIQLQQEELATLRANEKAAQ